MTFYSPKDAGRKLNLSIARLAQLDNAGVLPAVRDSSGRRFWPVEVVDAFAAERAAKRATALSEAEAVTAA